MNGVTHRRDALRTTGSLVCLCAVLFAAPAIAIEVPELDCVIEPHMVIDLSSRTDGIVDTIDVERGDLVEAGQVVVQLESDVERASVEYARAAAQAESDLLAGQVSMGFAERRRERLESLYVEKVLSSDQMDEMETEAELSKLQVGQARERNRLAKLELRRAQQVLEQHTLRSPIDGVVVQRFLAPGESVEEKPILRLGQIDPLRVEVIVPVSYFGAIDIGQQAIVSPERPIQDSYTADVTIVDRVADAASGTFRVRLSLPNPDYSLPSGLNCIVRFLDKPDDAPLLAEVEPVTSEPELNEWSASNRAAVAAALAYEPTRPPYIPHAGIAAAASADALASRPEALDKKAGPSSRLAAVAGAGKTAVKGSACRTIGPIDDADRAGALNVALADYVDDLAIRKESSPVKEGFIIVSPAQGSVAEAKGLAAEMEAAGLDDMFVFGRGRRAGRVSLGLYRKKPMAAERVAEIEAAGFSAELLPRSSSAVHYWIDVTGGQDFAGSRSTLPAAAQALLVDLEVTPTDCDPLLASGR